MSAAVSQLHVSFMPAHDRLLLRVATSGNQEVRLWLTRRFVKTLWPVLRDALQSDPAVAGHADQNTRNEVLSFQHQRAVQETEFTGGQYKAAPETRPLTRTPLLLTGAKCHALDADHARLALITARGRSFQLTLGRSTIHSLCKLIADCAGKADWQLELPLSQGATVSRQTDRTIN